MEKQATADADGPGAAERFWNRTPFRTYLFNAFSLLLPSGEQFVVRAMEDGAAHLHKRDQPADRDQGEDDGVRPDAIAVQDSEAADADGEEANGVEGAKGRGLLVELVKERLRFDHAR